jgi:hypothetical protein
MNSITSFICTLHQNTCLVHALTKSKTDAKLRKVDTGISELRVMMTHLDCAHQYFVLKQHISPTRGHVSREII